MADKPKDNPDWWSRILDARKSPPSTNPLEAMLKRPEPQPRPLSAGAVMRITNVVGTSDATCPCATWLAHWGMMSGQRALYCPVVGCMETDLCGAHVRKEGDRTVYILPLCSAHNKSAAPLEVSGIYKLVPASVSMTCGVRPRRR